MPRKAPMKKLVPKPMEKVQKSKVQKSKSKTLIATSAELAERECTEDQNMDVDPLIEGIDLGMIKQEEIKLEPEAVAGDKIDQNSANAAHTTSEVLVKIEPESALMTETFSNPPPAPATVSTPVHKKKKTAAHKKKAAIEKEKLAEKQEERQNRRAKNPDRHEENTAKLPDYRQFSQRPHQSTPSDPNEVDRMNFDLDVEEDVVVNFSPPEAPQIFMINDKFQSKGSGEALNAENDFNTICNAFEPTNDDFVSDMQIDDISSFGILPAIIECETNTTDDSRGIIKEIQTSDVTVTSVIVTNHASDNGNARLLKQNNAQSLVNSDTAGNIAASVTSASMPTKITPSKCPKVQIEHLQNVENPTKLHLRRRKQTHYLDADFSDSEDGPDECLFKSVTRKRDRPSRTVIDVEKQGSISIFDIESEANAGDAHNLHFPDTSMEGDTNKTVHSTIAGSGTSISEKRYKCAHCSYASNKSGNLLNHSRTHTGEKPYKCNKCSFACAQSNTLKTHIRTHTGEKPYKCDQCSFGSTQAGHLKMHMRTHTGEKSYKCSQCSYACAHLGNLKRHVRSHTGEKLFKCSQCSYASAQPNNLKSHMRTHSGEKPYKCNQCSYVCSRADLLKRHMRIHSGEKPYKCSQCSFASIQAVHVKNHMRTHNGEKPYKCNKCSFASAHSCALKIHMRTHTGEKPYKCIQCSYTCARFDGLKSHMRTHS